MNQWAMVKKEIFAGLAEGLKEFMKHSLTITILSLLAIGQGVAIWHLLQRNDAEQSEHREDLEQYMTALNTANLEIGKCIEFRQKCLENDTAHREEINGLKMRLARLERR